MSPPRALLCCAPPATATQGHSLSQPCTGAHHHQVLPPSLCRHPTSTTMRLSSLPCHHCFPWPIALPSRQAPCCTAGCSRHLLNWSFYNISKVKSLIDYSLVIFFNSLFFFLSFPALPMSRSCDSSPWMHLQRLCLPLELCLTCHFLFQRC